MKEPPERVESTEPQNPDGEAPNGIFVALPATSEASPDVAELTNGFEPAGKASITMDETEDNHVAPAETVTTLIVDELYDAPILKARLEAGDIPASIPHQSAGLAAPMDVVTAPMAYSSPTAEVAWTANTAEVSEMETGVVEEEPDSSPTVVKMELTEVTTVDVPLESMLTLGDRIKMTERSRFGRLRKKRCLSPSLVNNFAAAPKTKQPKKEAEPTPPAAKPSPKKRRRTPANPSLPVKVEPTSESSPAAVAAKPSIATPRKRKPKPKVDQPAAASPAEEASSDVSATIEEVIRSGGSCSSSSGQEKGTGVTTPKSPNPIKLKWLQSDVVWYKVQGQPWWPAKVACDPTSGFCTKMKVNFHTMYYLSPFGERDGAEWVSSCQILTFRGRDKFLQYVDSILSRFDVDSPFYDRTHTKFHVPESKRDAWEAAIMEADVAVQVASAMEDSLDKIAAGVSGIARSVQKRKSIKLSRHEVTLFANENHNGSLSKKVSLVNGSLQPSPVSGKSKKLKKELTAESNSAKSTTKEAPAAKSNAHPSARVVKKAVPTALKKYIKKLAPGSAVSTTKKLVAKAAATAATKGARSRQFKTVLAGRPQNGVLVKLPAPPAGSKKVPVGRALKGSISATLIFTPPKERTRIRRKKSDGPAPPKVNGHVAGQKSASPSARKRLSMATADVTGDDVDSPPTKSTVTKVKGIVIKKEIDADPVPETPANDRKRRSKGPGVKGVLPESGQNSGDSDSATESSLLAKRDFVPEGKKEKICLVCEKVISSSMVTLRCDGACLSVVHDTCANPALTSATSDGYKCNECITGIHSCFVCKRKGDGETETRKCSIYRCGKFYHDACLTPFRSAKMEGRSVMCSLHSCLSCILRNSRSKSGKGRLIRCLRCPVAFHNSESCLPAGSSVLSSSAIVCPTHYRPKKSSKNLHINVNWCFVCSTGGSLICCETCPASFHAECLNIVPPEGSYYCAECTAGTQPKYGDIVWVKLGVYRWWPAKICSPRNVPPNIQNLPHTMGEFPVHFFGTKDYYWTSRSRVFQFLEGDQSAQDSSSNRLSKMFKKALQDALQAFHEWKNAREIREAQDNERDSSKLPVYKHIKVNKPVGKATVPTVDPSQMTPCECDPNSENPCGSDSECLNRMLMFECHPDLCRAGSRCQNRRFEMQQYCPAEPFKAEGKGWGLKSLVEIKKGDFVNEYVGEIIDEEECRQRMKRMHEENNTSYYFLTIDKDRIIDAALKGNLSRFMNHSCQPNCETHKWTVNGEKRVGLFAVRHIPIGTELTFNYNLDCLGNEKTTCKCEAPNCSGFIGERPKNNLVKGKKVDKLVAGKKKRRRVRKIKPEVAVHDDECFRCGQDGELLMCDRKNCTKTYHLSCLDLAKPPHGRWECPWHHCDNCGRRATVLCFVCPNSFCKSHSVGNIHQLPDGNVCCRDHVEADRNRSNPQQGIDTALLEWLREQRALKIPVSGTAMQRRAEEIVTRLNIQPEYTVIDQGWLRQFRVRNAIAWHQLIRSESKAKAEVKPPAPATPKVEASEPETIVRSACVEEAVGTRDIAVSALPISQACEPQKQRDFEMDQAGVTECLAVLKRFVAGNVAIPEEVRLSVCRLETLVALLVPPSPPEADLAGKEPKSGAAARRLGKMTSAMTNGRGGKAAPVDAITVLQSAGVDQESANLPMGRLKLKVKLNGVTHHAEVIQPPPVAAKCGRMDAGAERPAGKRRKKRACGPRKRKRKPKKKTMTPPRTDESVPTDVLPDCPPNDVVAIEEQSTVADGMVSSMVVEVPSDGGASIPALTTSPQGGDYPPVEQVDVIVNGVDDLHDIADIKGNHDVHILDLHDVTSLHDANGVTSLCGVSDVTSHDDGDVASAGLVGVAKRKVVSVVRKRRARVHRVGRKRKSLPKASAKDIVVCELGVPSDVELTAAGEAVTSNGCDLESASDSLETVVDTARDDFERPPPRDVTILVPSSGLSLGDVVSVT